MKKKLLAILCAAALVLAVSACGAQPNGPGGDVPPDNGSVDGPGGVEDALRNVTEQELVEATGIDLPAPAGATDVVYNVLLASTDNPIAEMECNLDGKAICLRAQATDMLPPEQPGIDASLEELDAFMNPDDYNISGLYYDWEAMGTADIDGRSGMYCICKEASFIAWLDVVPGVLYNLSLKENSDAGTLTTLAETVFVPLQGDA